MKPEIIITAKGHAGTMATLLDHFHEFVTRHLHASEFHPDIWPPVLIRDPKETRVRVAACATRPGS